ncbi:MAG: hypothetical protein LLG05_15195 [Porphyromonadaceae bacterium]|nr:hypothetical protein [Porphyromonadaceae bacterium]
MKREQIIEIIKNNIQNIVVEDQLSGGDPPYLTHKYHNEWVGYDKAADAILDFPLDVPSYEEIEKTITNDYCFNSPMYIEGVRSGMLKMRDEIIKRNTKP